MKPLNPKYPGSEAVDELDHAIDLIRMARLSISALQADASNVSDEEIASIGYTLIYALDILQPVREAINSAGSRGRAAVVSAIDDLEADIRNLKVLVDVTTEMMIDCNYGDHKQTVADAERNISLMWIIRDSMDVLHKSVSAYHHHVLAEKRSGDQAVN